MMLKNRVIYVLCCATILMLGCKTTEPMYYYGNYSEAVYSYFKADETPVSQQISILEEVIAQAQGKGRLVAPGVHAHLGMLYFERGNNDQGINHFEHEKTLFPESAAYIDFLINKSSRLTI